MPETPEQIARTVPTAPIASSRRVAVLLGTYNGERYLEAQLQSIIRQSHQDWLIVASDDGSTDRTLELLRHYQQQLGEQRLHFVKGPQQGFVANFMALASTPNIQADYFAFSDQDDSWHADHLERALEWIESINACGPALHCSRTRLVRDNGHPFGLSPLFAKPPTFRNALVQSLAGGNTMVFNRSARELLIRTRHLPIVSHDWWLYMLVTGAGGHVRYCETPSVDYRQHGSNLVGANSSLNDRLHRIRRMFAGHFQQWNELNLAALNNCRDLLSAENRHTLDTFTNARSAALVPRLRGLRRSGVHRQTTPGNLGLLLAALLGRL